jgi:uncharacterized protein
MRAVAATLVLQVTLAVGVAAQEGRPARPPIIDIHLHAKEVWARPGEDAGVTFGPAFGERHLGLPAARSNEHLQEATLAALDRYNIVFAVVTGERAAQYRALDPARFLVGSDPDPGVPVDSLRAAFADGRYQVLAEFMYQFAGMAPDDPRLEPYFALAEELDVPVGIHLGLGPPGIAHRGAPAFRMAHGDPLRLEDVLIRHPRLRLYVMHAGWPRADEMIALLHAFPQVYVEIGPLHWYLPQPEFYGFLQRLVGAGFSRRVLFGSDQMQWPDAIGRAIETVEAAPFLNEEQRRDIMCRNAMRFLRLSSNVCD